MSSYYDDFIVKYLLLSIGNKIKNIFSLLLPPPLLNELAISGGTFLRLPFHIYFFWDELIAKNLNQYCTIEFSLYFHCFVMNWFSKYIFVELLYGIVYTVQQNAVSGHWRWIYVGLNLWFTGFLAQKRVNHGSSSASHPVF